MLSILFSNERCSSSIIKFMIALLNWSGQIYKYNILVMEVASEFMDLSILDILTHVRNVVVGIASVGLFIGAIFFTFYLIRLSRLPKKSRQYRELSYHMESETLLRYAISIGCLIILNILFYTFFEMGRRCTHIGVVIWSLYWGLSIVRQKILGAAKKWKWWLYI